MMKLNELKVNSKLMYFAKTYIVMSIDPPNVAIKRVDSDGEAISISFSELVLNPSFKASKTMVKRIEKENEQYTAILDNLPEKKRMEISERFEMIKPILVLEKIKEGKFTSYYEFMDHYREYLKSDENVEMLNQTELIGLIAKKYGVSDRTIYRYLTDFRKAAGGDNNRGEEGLVSKAGTGYQYRSDNRKIDLCHPNDPDWVLETIAFRKDEKYIPIIKEVLENHYLTVQKKDKSAVIELIQIKCLKEGLEPLKTETIYKLLGRISDRTKERAREGKRGNEKYDPVERGHANQEALYPLHIVEIDHTPLDLDVIDGESGLVIGRPFLTLGIDVYSRMIWCMYLSFEPPSANRVRKAIQQGVLFKRTKDNYNTTYEWDVFGVPDIIQMDNGSEFNNYKIKRLINETLKSNVRYRPRSTPRYGGTIERLFRTVNSKWIHTLDGTRKSSVADLGEYDPEANAALTLENVREILIRYFTDIYPFETHRGLPLDVENPISRYINGLKKRGYPEFIAEEDEELFKIELLPSEMKPYTRDGVTLENVRYKSPELTHLIDKSKVKYKVKYDDDDISKIYIQLPDSARYIEVGAVNPSADSLKGINRFTYKKIIEITREKNSLKSIPSSQEVLKAKEKLRDDIDRMYKKNRKTRQQTERLGLQVEVKRPEAISSSNSDPTLYELKMMAKKAREKRGLKTNA
ncbi:Mu transposase C-terminal domain-containing protein [Paenibacillus sedimenti]|uniref:Transposase family protein n=1 Tax=Paenibacillus sedimenti TaxID=2770274 RepID=A0A926KX64_9BACL|nr:Mu transposase C-terminal domain-containing protein [Paenibacillus sedimenti]MBD0383873.1 transposase family protein [Paenibacillus sedimenti]